MIAAPPLLVLWIVATTPPPPYMCARTAPFHPSIHNMGNVGAGGYVHSRMAMAFTRAIDRVAYKGVNMRARVAELVAERVPLDTKVLDVGCGVGPVAEQLARRGFANVVALDTSSEMLDVARRRASHVTFLQQNGVDARVEHADAGAAVVCMVMHEMPEVAHVEMIRSLAEATRKSSGQIVIVDIHPSYTPSWTMLTGEPYLLAYLEGFEDVVHDLSDELGMRVSTKDLVEGRVRAWVLSRDATQPRRSLPFASQTRR